MRIRARRGRRRFRTHYRRGPTDTGILIVLVIGLYVAARRAETLRLVRWSGSASQHRRLRQSWVSSGALVDHVLVRGRSGWRRADGDRAAGFARADGGGRGARGRSAGRRTVLG